MKELDVISALKSKKIVYDKGVRSLTGVRGCFTCVQFKEEDETTDANDVPRSKSIEYREPIDQDKKALKQAFMKIEEQQLLIKQLQNKIIELTSLNKPPQQSMFKKINYKNESLQRSTTKTLKPQKRTTDSSKLLIDTTLF
jgi:hypothetical protein